MDQENALRVPVELADLQLVIGRLRDIYDVAQCQLPADLQAALDALDAAMDAAAPE